MQSDKIITVAEWNKLTQDIHALVDNCGLLNVQEALIQETATRFGMANLHNSGKA